MGLHLGGGQMNAWAALGRELGWWPLCPTGHFCHRSLFLLQKMPTDGKQDPQRTVLSGQRGQLPPGVLRV